MPLICLRSVYQRPSSTARTKSRNTSSPSPRTMASIWGASDRTCLNMKVGCGFFGDLKDAFGTVDGGGDGGATHNIWLQLGDAGAQLILFDIIGHRVDEGDVVIARSLERTGEIGHPCGGPVAGDFGTAGMIVRMDQEQFHGASYSRQACHAMCQL